MFTRTILSALAVVSLAACGTSPTEPNRTATQPTVASVCNGTAPQIVQILSTTPKSAYIVTWCTATNTAKSRQINFNLFAFRQLNLIDEQLVLRNYLACEESYSWPDENNYCIKSLPFGVSAVYP